MGKEQLQFQITLTGVKRLLYERLNQMLYITALGLSQTTRLLLLPSFCLSRQEEEAGIHPVHVENVTWSCCN